MTVTEWARLVVATILLVLAPAAAGAQGALYSISADFNFDASNNPLTFLRRLDPATGQTLSSVPISMVNPPPPLHPGDDRNTFVLSGNGLAVHPQTGQLFAILTVESESDDDLPERHLATIDPATGLATLIGSTSRLAGLAFTTGGALGAGALLAVTGDGRQGAFCPAPSTVCLRSALYRLGQTDAQATLLTTFNTPDDGEAIAFDPVDLRLYHASGSGTGQVFEAVDLGALGGPTTPVPLTGLQNDEITALTFSSAGFLAADLSQNLLSITPAGVVALIGPLDHKSKGLAFVAPPPPTTLVASVLPSSRSVQVGSTATAFATIINAGGNPALGVGISLASGIPAAFKYNVTDCASNVVIGADNAPATIVPGGAACYVVAITPSAQFPPTEVAFNFAGINTPPVGTLVAINTLLMSASLSPVADIVALAATTTNDGIVHVPGVGGAGAFAVATSNVGAGDLITASANTGGAALPLALSLCQTDPLTGGCISAIGPSVTVAIGPGATPTFGIFVSASAAIPLDPANSRVFVVFVDSAGVIRGRTSVAVTTL